MARKANQSKHAAAPEEADAGGRAAAPQAAARRGQPGARRRSAGPTRGMSGFTKTRSGTGCSRWRSWRCRPRSACTSTPRPWRRECPAWKRRWAFGKESIDAVAARGLRYRERFPRDAWGHAYHAERLLERDRPEDRPRIQELIALARQHSRRDGVDMFIAELLDQHEVREQVAVR